MKLASLVYACLEGDASEDQIALLQERLRDDPEAQRFYAEFLAIYADLRRSGANLLTEPGAAPASVLPPQPDRKVREIEEYANRQLEAFLHEEHAKERPVRTYERQGYLREIVEEQLEKWGRLVGVTVRTLKTGVVCVSVLMVAWIVISHMRAPDVVATLGDSVHARWDVEPQSSRLDPGWLTLREGFAQIELGQGTDLVLQAPCRFELQSPNRLFLETGSIAARVPKRAVGFTIETPKSNVVDFGTEFGVLARADGSNETYVFDGKVGVQSPPGAAASQAPGMLTEGQGLAVDTSGQFSAIPHKTSLIARGLPEATPFAIPGRRLNLADIVGEGSGFGIGRPNGTIDTYTGQFRDDLDDRSRMQTAPYSVPLHLRTWVPAYAEDAEGRMAVSGAGAASIRGAESTEDDFRFVYQHLRGDGSLAVRVDSLDRMSEYSSAAVMIRESLDTGAKHASAVVNYTDSVLFQCRQNDGAEAERFISTRAGGQGTPTPIWLRIERVGNTFRGYYAREKEGPQWLPISKRPQVIEMPSDVYIGMGVSSGKQGYPTLATFSQTVTTGHVTGRRTSVVVGDEAGHPANGYVSVPRHAYVDGVFCLQASSMPTAVTSLGHSLVLSPGSEPQVPTASGGVTDWLVPGEPSSMGGNGQAGRPAILMRRNNGITFDLDAIRADMAGVEIDRFTVRCGLPDMDTNRTSSAPVSYYVLVDGQPRFMRTVAADAPLGEPIDIPLRHRDRFLTLMAAFLENTDTETPLWRSGVGGLMDPNSARLGDLAVTTATQDYFHMPGGGAFAIGGLERSSHYVFHLFASYDDEAVQVTQYDLQGNNFATVSLQTSGPDLGGPGYDGNTKTVAVSNSVSPDKDGEVVIRLSALQGSSCYLSAMKIEETDGARRVFYIDFGPPSGNDVMTRNPDENGNTWNNVVNGWDPGYAPSLVDSDNNPSALYSRNTESRQMAVFVEPALELSGSSQGSYVSAEER